MLLRYKEKTKKKKQKNPQNSDFTVCINDDMKEQSSGSMVSISYRGVGFKYVSCGMNLFWYQNRTEVTEWKLLLICSQQPLDLLLYPSCIITLNERLLICVIALSSAATVEAFVRKCKV